MARRRLIIGLAAGLAVVVAGGGIGLAITAAQPQPARHPRAAASQPDLRVASPAASQPSPSASAAVTSPMAAATTGQVTTAPVVRLTSSPPAPAPPPPSPASAAGTLSVHSPTPNAPPGAAICGGTPVLEMGYLTLQAIGGPVSWTATVSVAPLTTGQPGSITLSATSGTLAPGQPPMTIDVTCAALEPSNAGEITFEPGPVYVPVYN